MIETFVKRQVMYYINYEGLCQADLWARGGPGQRSIGQAPTVHSLCTCGHVDNGTCPHQVFAVTLTLS